MDVHQHQVTDPGNNHSFSGWGQVGRSTSDYLQTVIDSSVDDDWSISISGRGGDIHVLVGQFIKSLRAGGHTINDSNIFHAKHEPDEPTTTSDPTIGGPNSSTLINWGHKSRGNVYWPADPG